MPCCGNQLQLVAASTHRDWPTPMSSPATAATVKDENRATSAAASAGTTARVSVLGLSEVIGAASMPASAASVDAIAQLAASHRTGHHPSSAAARSFCATARVTTPKRVKRYRAVRHSPAASAIPASHNRSRPTVAPRIVTVSVGSTRGLGRASLPNWMTASACSASISPIDATTRASAGARRSQRKITR